MKRISLKERFLKKIKINEKTGCWEWLASKNKKGYGTIGEGGEHGKVLRAHRVAYQLYVGDIPEKMHVLHKCDNIICVCPLHLFIGTNNDNVKDKVSKNRQSRMIGERHGYAKLKNEDVIAIKRHLCLGILSIAEISELINVSTTTVYWIKHNKQ